MDIQWILSLTVLLSLLAFWKDAQAKRVKFVFEFWVFRNHSPFQLAHRQAAAADAESCLQKLSVEAVKKINLQGCN